MQILYSTPEQNFVYVDDEDLEKCLQYEWYFNTHTGYLTARVGRGIPLHTIIKGPAPDGLETDHIDRNPLNNCKNNLRFITHSENIINSRRASTATKYIYVTPEGNYKVQIVRNYKKLHVGHYKTRELAVQARDNYIKNVLHEQILT